jgi:hypothetical protein
MIDRVDLIHKLALKAVAQKGKPHTHVIVGVEGDTRIHAALFNEFKPATIAAMCERIKTLEGTLSEVLAIFRDEDVEVTPETKERWHKVLGGETDG